MRRAACALILLALGGAAGAHPLAPALLEIKEATIDPGLRRNDGNSQYDILWRSSAARVQQGDVQPVFPDGCREVSTPTAMVESAQAVALRWQLQCAAPLAGQRLRIDGLERSSINVILRLADAQGRVTEELLDAGRSSLIVPRLQSAPPVLPNYFALGVRHLLTGADHLLFLLGLVLLVPGLRRLVLTVTAFTLGHSVTLALAVLGFVRVNPAFTELAIALTILVLGCELARPAGAGLSPLMQRPWLMAGGFGLVHGLGFAGALAQVGFPADEIPRSLLAFNVGIEAGQLLMVALALAGLSFLKSGVSARLRGETLTLTRLVPAYVIGSLAAYWCVERGVQMIGA